MKNTLVPCTSWMCTDGTVSSNPIMVRGAGDFKRLTQVVEAMYPGEQRLLTWRNVTKKLRLVQEECKIDKSIVDSAEIPDQYVLSNLRRTLVQKESSIRGEINNKVLS